ncbi:MAG TPA: AglZ/HisF2 family acetamidino modification protein [Chitinophagaceae bacterium]|nr:AglZ/HisF2 family acetamidino modification protein [Chitinophagaceae bacterium]
MFSPRIIPVLLYKNGGLVKSVRFRNYTYIGDPINAVRIFNDSYADEIIILDIEASKKGSFIDLQLVKEVGEEANMPFSVGGGVDSLEKISSLLKNGAEKAIINSAALDRIDFVKEASDYFGSSTITVCVDIRKNLFGKYQVYSHRQQKALPVPYIDFIRQVQDCGAGEIIIQSVDNDGMMNGYDHRLYETLSKEISIPVVALGGAGDIHDMEKLWNQSSVNSFSAGSVFVYFNKMRGVLINYPKIDRNEFRKKFRQ